MTGLEALKIVERDCEDLEQVPYGEFALIEKYLKALEIIKEKNVDTYYLITCPSLESYNSETWNKLTQEEYDLLREVLVE